MCEREKMARSRLGTTGATVKSEPNLNFNNAWDLKRKEAHGRSGTLGRDCWAKGERGWTTKPKKRCIH